MKYPFAFYSHSAMVAVLVAALSACSVGPDYKAPETSLPSKWVTTDVEATQAPIDHAWWANFNDPVLNQLISKAVEGNLDLQMAEARIYEARATRSTATATLLPTGDVKGNVTREANQFAFPHPIAGLTDPFTSYQTGFDASWELDLFGGHRRQIEAATDSLEASQASRDDALVSLKAEVARTYIDIRNYQAQLQTVEETLKANKNTADIARQRYDAGQNSRLDLTQAEAQLEQTSTQVPYYTNLLAQAEFSMDVLVGEQPGATHALFADKKSIPYTDKKLVMAAPARVIANRPDIRIAERQLAAATAQQGVAVAKFFPDISLSGFIGFLNSNSSDLLKSASKSWLMGGSVVWPILSYGTLSANLDVADAQQQEAMLTYRKSIIVALSDVEKSYKAYTEQEKFRQIQVRAVAADQHTLKIAQEQYKEGLTAFIDVLDAQRTLYAAQSQLNDATAKTTQNLVAVYKSLGGGWQQASTKTN